MVEGFVTNQEKLEFKQIVLQHLKDILKLSQTEWRGGYEVRIPHPYANGQMYYTNEYIPDTRESYFNAVVSLSDILLPYFDKMIKQKYENYIKFIDMTNREAYREIKEEILKEYEKDKIDDDDTINNFITDRKLRYAQLLFRELNLLLHRIDYLKSSVFGEGESEAEEEEDFVEVDK